MKNLTKILTLLALAMAGGVVATARDEAESSPELQQGAALTELQQEAIFDVCVNGIAGTTEFVCTVLGQELIFFDKTNLGIEVGRTTLNLDPTSLNEVNILGRDYIILFGIFNQPSEDFNYKKTGITLVRDFVSFEDGSFTFRDNLFRLGSNDVNRIQILLTKQQEVCIKTNYTPQSGGSNFSYIFDREKSDKLARYIAKKYIEGNENNIDITIGIHVDGSDNFKTIMLLYLKINRAGDKINVIPDTYQHRIAPSDVTYPIFEPKLRYT